MKELLIYISQVSLLVLCAYVVYKVIFARDTFHGIKRFVLLFMIVISFVLPKCKITIQKVVAENTSNEMLINDILPPGDFTEANWQIVGQEASFDWFMLIGILYFTGVVAMLAYRFIGIRRVNAMIKKSSHKYLFNGIDVLLVPDNIPAFSFRNKIIMSQVDYEVNSEIIIRHELIHIKQRHSADLRFINLVLSLQWFNPFMWFIRRELILTHEFSADQGVIKSGIDAKKYQYLLISKSTGSQGLIPVVNHFCSSDLCKRIKTMKRKSSKLMLLKLLIVYPLLSLALVAFADTKYTLSESTTEITQEKEQFCMPYQGRIMSKYGKRLHPRDNKVLICHDGIDIIVTNDTIRSPYSGVVKSANYSKSGSGNRLVMTHENDLEITYAHLAKSFVQEGTAVKGGDPIGLVGNTGRATGKHLHLECRIKGELVDPETTLPLSN